MEECRAPAPTPGSPLNREWALAIQHCNSRRDVRTAHFALPLNPAHERTRTRCFVHELSRAGAPLARTRCFVHELSRGSTRARSRRD